MGNVNDHDVKNPLVPLRKNKNPHLVLPDCEKNFPNRRMRRTYSRQDKKQAVQMFNNGVSSRRVAQIMGPKCSSASIVRWRQARQRRDVEIDGRWFENYLAEQEAQRNEALEAQVEELQNPA